MNEPELLATMDVLRDFGFVPSDEPDPGFDESLVYDFGNYKLYATLGVNRYLRNAVMFSGSWSTGRNMGLIEFEIPSQVESRELCAAFIRYYLDAPPGSHPPEWLRMGARNQDLLPWRRDLRAYEARPLCTVQRDWLRLGLKTLAAQLSSVSHETPVTIAFADGVLSIRCAGSVIALPGEGRSWPEPVAIPAGKLRLLPRRLTGERISVSVWDSRLEVGRWHSPRW